MERQTSSLVHLLIVALTALAFSACATSETPERLRDESTYEVNYWEMNKENCEDVLRDPYTFTLARVEQCTKLWEMYQTVHELSIDLRSMYAVGFSRLYHESSGEIRAQAHAALQRVCIPPHPLGPDGRAREIVPQRLDCGNNSPFRDSVETVSPEQRVRARVSQEASNDVETVNDLKRRRAVIDLPMVEARQQRKANTREQEADAFLQQGQYAHAIDRLRDTLEVNPYDVGAKYKLAQAYALIGEQERAIAELAEMQMWNHPAVTQRLLRARSEDAFRSLRDDLRFKAITGYRRLTLLNGAGEGGVASLTQFAKNLLLRDYLIERVATDPNLRMYPIVYHKPVFEAEADALRALIGNGRARTAPINWESRDDFVVVWGDASVGELYAAEALDEPIYQGEPPTDPGDALQEALDEVDALKGQLEDFKGRAEGLGDDVQDQAGLSEEGEDS